MAILEVSATVLGFIKDAVFVLAVLVAVSVLSREGASGLARGCLRVLKNLSVLDKLIQWYLRKEVRGFLKQIDPQTFSKSKKKKIEIPREGM